MSLFSSSRKAVSTQQRIKNNPLNTESIELEKSSSNTKDTVEMNKIKIKKIEKEKTKTSSPLPLNLFNSMFKINAPSSIRAKHRKSYKLNKRVLQ